MAFSGFKATFKCEPILARGFDSIYPKFQYPEVVITNSQRMEMRNAKIIWLSLIAGFLLLQGSPLTESSVRFTKTPGSDIWHYEGSNVTFTWDYIPTSELSRIIFGVWESNDITKYIMTLASPLWKPTPNPDVSVLQYFGRVRWAGDLSKNRASFQLKGVTRKDASVYAIKLEPLDIFANGKSDTTNVTVLPQSVFLQTESIVYTSLGSDARFTWQYSLNGKDALTLSSITWGVLQNGLFKVLCDIKVMGTAAVSQSCSSGKSSEIIQPTSKASFILNDIRDSDEGEYQLRLRGTAKPLDSVIALFVTDPPVITLQPEPTVVREGNPLILSCAADGRPIPSYEWLKDGHVITDSSNSTLEIKSASREDAGRYQCVASNRIGNETSRYADVTVYYPPTVNLTEKRTIVKLPLGASETLSCPAVGNPSPIYQWYKGIDHYISNGHHISVTVATEAEYVTYLCEAENELGTDNATFVLVKVGPPTSPRVDCGKREDTTNSRDRKFHWTPPSDDGGAPVLFYTVKYRTVRGTLGRGPWVTRNISVSSTWHQFSLDWDKVYELSVTAWNKYGESVTDLELDTCVVTVGADPSAATTTALPPPVVESQDFVDKIPGGKITLYVGIAGALVLLLIVVIALVHRSHVRKSKEKVKNWSNQQISISGHLDGHFWEGPSAAEDRKQSMVGSPSYHMDPQWAIPREKISILKVIGNGAFGLVYKGRVHGLGTNRPGWNLVAIKSPYADASDRETRDLMKEFELLKTLKPHPHVIKMLGCGEDDGRPLVIIEYVPHGDLLGYLRKSRGEEDDYYSDPEIKPKTSLSSQQLIRFAWQVADGMEYLSSQKIIHRDLAARNILVGEGEVCKVADFGMAKDVSIEDIYIRTTEGRLPVKWTAVEALIGGGEYTTLSDVWSFGVVLYEICTIGGEPYPGIAGKDIPDCLETGYRMPCPTHVDATLYQVMASCWATCPDDRPTFASLQKLLNTLEAVQSKDYINLSECLNKGHKGKGTGKEKRYHRDPTEQDHSWPVAV
ncbi:fibroblast growth factor receptor 4 isoform X2 [Nematostella vectensis]|uniref:fibroblast growth factor receptor 4 isoform X2 n=1 Tax=Nematostella vectensis TaxID=45351 RepID=UPI0020778D1A|nr:fibroblast growth factor receptor 4 isoform X2 [Nematostella vectensis]